MSETKYTFKELELKALMSIAMAEAIVFMNETNWNQLNPLSAKDKLETIVFQHLEEVLKRKEKKGEIIC